MKARNFYPFVLLISVFLLAAARSDASKSPLAGERATAAAPAKERQLRIIAFGAHPDDCEIRAADVNPVVSVAIGGNQVVSTGITDNKLIDLFVKIAVETTENPFKFTPQCFDHEIEECYLRARQYNPPIVRYCRSGTYLVTCDAVLPYVERF